MSLYCGRCEKPLEGHDARACARRMSRRHFFGLLGGAAAALAVPKRIPTGGLFNPHLDVFGQYAALKFHPVAFTLEWPELAALQERYVTPAVLQIANRIDTALQPSRLDVLFGSVSHFEYAEREVE